MGPVDVDNGALLAGLHDIRLPVESAGGRIADIAVALALGLIVALLLAPVVRALSRPRAPQAARDLQSRIAALGDLTTEGRRDALLRLAAEFRPDVLRQMQPEIYQPGKLPSAEQLEAALGGAPQ